MKIRHLKSLYTAYTSALMSTGNERTPTESPCLELMHDLWSVRDGITALPLLSLTTSESLYEDSEACRSLFVIGDNRNESSEGRDHINQREGTSDSAASTSGTSAPSSDIFTETPSKKQKNTASTFGRGCTNFPTASLKLRRRSVHRKEARLHWRPRSLS